jgi:hypothetical protein
MRSLVVAVPLGPSSWRLDLQVLCAGLLFLPSERCIRVRTMKGVEVIVPNSDLAAWPLGEVPDAALPSESDGGSDGSFSAAHAMARRAIDVNPGPIPTDLPGG